MKTSVRAAILLFTYSSNRNSVSMAFTTAPHHVPKHILSVTLPYPIRQQSHRYHQPHHHSSSTHTALSSSSSSSQSTPPPETPSQPTPTPTPEQISQATQTLQHYDSLQQTYIAQNPVGMGGGTTALEFLRTQLTPSDKTSIRSSIQTLSSAAAYQRALDPSQGRVMLGFCAENVPEAMIGLKTWIPTLKLPRGLLHGMDVDGEPIADPETLGSVYVKYNTGGSMTFQEMRKSGLGFDALWRPGDAVLQTYEGDFRGVYFNVELEDGEFRQFGVLPTDLFVEEEEW